MGCRPRLKGRGRGIQESRTPASRVPARSRARHMGSCARHIDKVPRSGESSADDAPTSPRPSPNLFISLMRWALVPLAWLYARSRAARSRRPSLRPERAEGRRGRAGLLSLSAPGGGEGRGEVGVSSPARPMARSWRGRSAPCSAPWSGLVSRFRSSFACCGAGARSLRPTTPHTPSCPDLFRASPEPGPPDAGQNTWMAGTSPAMTCRGRRAPRHGPG